jgi:hypothetical protein
MCRSGDCPFIHSPHSFSCLRVEYSVVDNDDDNKEGGNGREIFSMCVMSHVRRLSTCPLTRSNFSFSFSCVRAVGNHRIHLSHTKM